MIFVSHELKGFPRLCNQQYTDLVLSLCSSLLLRPLSSDLETFVHLDKSTASHCQIMEIEDARLILHQTSLVPLSLSVISPLHSTIKPQPTSSIHPPPSPSPLPPLPTPLPLSLLFLNLPLLQNQNPTPAMAKIATIPITTPIRAPRRHGGEA